MTEEFQEYVTFTVTNRQGKEVELAVVDEFEFEHKNYVAAALIVEDTISEDGLYIYKVIAKGEEYSFEQISDAKEYENVAKAYMDLED